MTTIGSLFVSVGFATEDLEKGAQKAGGILKDFSKNGVLALGAVGAGAVAMGAKVGAAAFELSNDLEKSQLKFQTSLGVSEKAAENYADIVESVWGQNFGDNIDDVTDSLIQVNKQLGLVDDGDAIEAAVINTHRLVDAFDDLDKSQVLNSVNVLVEEFGLTSDQAFDFITTGMQRGLNASDDFLDTIGEYGNQFATAGFGAESFFGIMESGMAGGVLGTDKIADAFKEFNILWTEGNQDLKDTLATLYGVPDAYESMVASGKDVDQIMSSIIGRMNTIEDVNQRAMMERTIFGTMAEDLGPGFTADLRFVTAELESMAGATEALDTQYNTFGDMFQGVWRQILVAVKPVTDFLLQMGKDAMPVLLDFFTRAQPIIQDFAAVMVDTLGAALPSIGDSLYRIGAALGIGEENASGMDMALSFFSGTLDLLVTGVEAFTILMYGLATAVEYTAAAFAWLDDAGGKTAAAFDNAATIRGAALSDPGALWSAMQQEFGFAQGGLVPGRLGQPQMIVAHGGEHVSPVGQASTGGNIYIDGINVGSADNIQEALQEAFEIITAKIGQS